MNKRIAECSRPPWLTDDDWIYVDDPDTWETLGRFHLWVSYLGTWYIALEGSDVVHGPFDRKAEAVDYGCDLVEHVICGKE